MGSQALAVSTLTLHVLCFRINIAQRERHCARLAPWLPRVEQLLTAHHTTSGAAAGRQRRRAAARHGESSAPSETPGASYCAWRNMQLVMHIQAGCGPATHGCRRPFTTSARAERVHAVSQVCVPVQCYLCRRVPHVDLLRGGLWTADAFSVGCTLAIQSLGSGGVVLPVRWRARCTCAPPLAVPSLLPVLCSSGAAGQWQRGQRGRRGGERQLVAGLCR
jgi:hypothetical protein